MTNPLYEILDKFEQAHRRLDELELEAKRHWFKLQTQMNMDRSEPEGNNRNEALSTLYRR